MTWLSPTGCWEYDFHLVFAVYIHVSMLVCCIIEKSWNHSNNFIWNLIHCPNKHPVWYHSCNIWWCILPPGVHHHPRGPAAIRLEHRPLCAAPGGWPEEIHIHQAIYKQPLLWWGNKYIMFEHNNVKLENFSWKFIGFNHCKFDFGDRGCCSDTANSPDGCEPIFLCRCCFRCDFSCVLALYSHQT